MTTNLAQTLEIPREIRDAMEQEFLPKNHINVPQKLHSPHPLVAAKIREEQLQVRSYRQYGSYKPDIYIRMRSYSIDRIFSNKSTHAMAE
jgi:hypothetical protein